MGIANCPGSMKTTSKPEKVLTGNPRKKKRTGGKAKINPKNGINTSHTPDPKSG